jgi:hypothetical protein
VEETHFTTEPVLREQQKGHHSSGAPGSPLLSGPTIEEDQALPFLCLAWPSKRHPQSSLHQPPLLRSLLKCDSPRSPHNAHLLTATSQNRGCVSRLSCLVVHKIMGRLRTCGSLGERKEGSRAKTAGIGSLVHSKSDSRTMWHSEVLRWCLL